MRKLIVLIAVVLAAAGGSSALGAGALTGHPGDIQFGSVARGDSVTRIETLENASGADVDITAITVSGAVFDKVSDDCPGTLADTATCQVTVSYSPNGTGPDSGSLDVAEGSGDTDSFTLSGTGTDPIDVQATSLSFGDQRVGTTSPAQPVRVSNTSGHAVDLNIQLQNQQDFGISGCGGLGNPNVLAGGDSCNVQVVFSPNSTGSKSGTLTVAGHDVPLSGRGTTNRIDVSPQSIAFGNQPVSTTSAARVVTVTNTGTEDLHVGTPSVGGTNPLQFAVSDNCTGIAVLGPGDQCTITIAFAPTVRGGLSATLQITSDAVSGDETVDLAGTGTPSAVVFGPAPVQFKRPHHAGTFSSKKTITLTNRTSGPLVISRVHLGGQNPKSFRITGGTCGGRTLAADGTCTEVVRFAPNDVGVKSASLVVNDDDPDSPHSVQLNARATYPRDDANVIGAAGCDATKITWRKGGTSRRFARTVIVRSRGHIPTGPNDGRRRPHGIGVLHDVGLAHFTTYQYRVFALYRSHTRPGTYNHSRGVLLHLRTGEICSPMDGAVIGTTTPKASWLRHSTLFGYSFLLFHGHEQVQVKRSVNALQFRFRGHRRLHHGFTYTLFLYAYPPSQPEGTSIGRTTFRVR
jgi:hypothetical protein